MIKLNIRAVGFTGIQKEEINSSKKELEKILKDIPIDWLSEEPEIIWFVSGGSEFDAKKIIKNSKHCILLANDKNNSYAAATEVKAFANTSNINTHLFNINNEESLNYLSDYYKLKHSISNLKGKVIGLIGNVSTWLIASDLKSEDLNEKFGIKVKQVKWEDLKDYKKNEINSEFNSAFENNKIEKLNDSGRVYDVLKEAILKERLDSISVECFPLVKQHKVTACLGLGKLNEEGMPAGCEGDIPSTVGLMLVKELTGFVPWMANLASLTSEKILFAHCTINPNLVSDIELLSHYETDEGLAIRGDFIGDEITVFRFNKTFSKIFISSGKIVSRPKYNTACRTQIEVKLPKDAVEKLQNNPLGNHHIIIPGNWKSQLETLSMIKGIEMI